MLDTGKDEEIPQNTGQMGVIQQSLRIATPTLQDQERSNAGIQKVLLLVKSN